MTKANTQRFIGRVDIAAKTPSHDVLFGLFTVVISHCLKQQDIKNLVRLFFVLAASRDTRLARYFT